MGIVPQMATAIEIAGVSMAGKARAVEIRTTRKTSSKEQFFGSNPPAV
jgi:hypothetical protein